MRAAVLCLALVAGSAHAEFVDGNKLLSDMNGVHGFQMSALGYVMGVADTLQNVVVCIPSNVTSGQVADMVRNYLTNVPRERHLSGDILVGRVLKEVWPCATRPPGRQL
jgi:hypothetical protein